MTKKTETETPDETMLHTVEKGRDDLNHRTAQAIKDLDSGKVKVAILVTLEADGSIGQFVTDGTASRVELVGLAAMLLQNLTSQKL